MINTDWLKQPDIQLNKKIETAKDIIANANSSACTRIVLNITYEFFKERLKLGYEDYKIKIPEASPVLFDLPPQLQQHRQEAIIRTAEDFRRKYANKYKDVNSDKFFVRLNAVNYPKWFTVFDYKIYYSIAIWIIRIFEKNDMLSALYHYVYKKGNVIEENYGLPESLDYDNQLINDLYHIILHRNGNEVNKEIMYPENFRKTFKKSNDENEKLSDTELFDEIMALIPKEDIDKAINYFKKLVFDYLEVAYDGYAYFEKKELTYAKRIVNSSVLSSNQLLNINTNWNTMQEYTRKKTFYIDAVADTTDRLDYDISAFSEVKHIVKNFDKIELNDPYSIIFAIFYLLMTDSDLAWCFNSYISIVTWAVEALPCDIDAVFEEIDDVTDYSSTINDTVLLNKHPFVVGDTRSTMNLYHAIYSITNKTIEKPISLPDKVYEIVTKDFSEKDKEELLKACLGVINNINSNLVSSQITKLLNKFSGEDDSEVSKQEAATEIETDNTEYLSVIKKQEEELKKLKKQIKVLASETYQFKKDTDKYKELYDKEQEKYYSSQKELAELKTLICPVEDTTKHTHKSKIEFPYYTNNKFVVYGGHDSFLRTIKHLLPNVKFVGPDEKPVLSVINNVDAVWCQNNAIPHAFFNPVVDRTRKLDVPFKYFDYASAEKCAEQLVEYDIKLTELKNSANK